MSIRSGFKRLWKLAFVFLPIVLATVFAFQRPVEEGPAASDIYSTEWTAFSSPLGTMPAEKEENEHPLWSLLLATTAEVGQWSPIMGLPVVAIHGIMTPSGDVLLIDRILDGPDAFRTKAWVFRPSTNRLVEVDYSQASLFCSGHILLPDGRILVVGGHDNNQDDDGLDQINVFNTRLDPFRTSSGLWLKVATMVEGRWYPSTLMMGDGRVFIAGGAVNHTGPLVHDDASHEDPESYTPAMVPEIFNPSNNTVTALTNQPRNVLYYPQMYMMPTGNRIFFTLAGDDLPLVNDFSYVYDADLQTWTQLPSGFGEMGSSSVEYDLGKILWTRGSATFPGFNLAVTIDLNASPLGWVSVAPMKHERDKHNLVVLPDGKVLAVGGSFEIAPENVANSPASAVLVPEIWDPSTKIWNDQLPAMKVPRLYHSIALLLPDGRVMVAGTGKGGQTTDTYNAEFYSPAYLFKGPRPTITAVQHAPITAGGMIQVQSPQAASIRSAALISLPAVTHAFNENQRYIPLTNVVGFGTTVRANIPANRNFVSPGFYMLFILNAQGVPSVASIVRVG